MGIKKRILLFVTLFGVGAGAVAIVLNQLMLKSSLITLQEKQVRTSVELGQYKINQLINEMEQASLDLALFASEMYQIKQDKYSIDSTEQMMKSHLTSVFQRNENSIGGGIWFEPYLFKPDLRWFGPYVHKQGEDIVFTWDLSNAEYDYHNHDWYKIAFQNNKKNDKTVYWSKPYYDDAGTEALMVTVTSPVLDTAGDKIGVATVDWAIHHLADVVESIEFTENASSFLINSVTKLYLSFPDAPQLHLQPVTKDHWGRKVLNAIADNKVDKLEQVEFNGQSGVVYFRLTKQNLVLGVFLPDSDYMGPINEYTRVNLLLSGVLLVIFLFGLAYTLNRLFSPLSDLIDEISASVSFEGDSNHIRVKRINEKTVKELSPVIKMLNSVYDNINDYTLQIEKNNSVLLEQQKEINELNNYLEQKVSERTYELKQKNNKITQVLEELQETQNQLIEMEKNAALGQLVTGIAHEINTPVGVCVTATSVLSEQYLNIKKQLDAGTLTKDAMDDFLQSVDDVAEIMEFNLNRTKELIESFKQVSADQSVEQPRIFNLSDYMSLITHSLKLNLEQAAVNVEISSAKNILVDSYPGILSQIMSNLIMNSINHAFSGEQQRLIIISIKEENDNIIRITYTDNGKGMDKETAARVFEPFFTTRRGQGGIGLGMHITYNLITQKLKGSISVDSTPGEGTRFTLQIPFPRAKEQA